MTAICPIDGLALESVSSNGKIAYCRRCQGCWVNGNAMRDLLAGNHADGAARERLFDERVAQCKPADRLCPEHRNTMSRFYDRAIELDICPNCKGVWFDSGELKRLMAPTAGHAGAVAAGAATAAVAATALAGEDSTRANEQPSGDGDSVVEGALDMAVSAIGILDILDLF